MLRLDDGGEYTSSEMRDFCGSVGIKRELSVPYKSQQNGVAERNNRTIVGAARAMLHDQSLPFFLWVEACNTIVYLRYRSPHRVLGSKTSEKIYTGKKPEVGQIKIFGCLAYSHVPEEKRMKLEPTAERVILMGYNETSRAYRIYLPAQRKIVLRRDVTFEEEKALRRSRAIDQVKQQAPQQGTTP